MSWRRACRRASPPGDREGDEEAEQGEQRRFDGRPPAESAARLGARAPLDTEVMPQQLEADEAHEQNEQDHQEDGGRHAHDGQCSDRRNRDVAVDSKNEKVSRRLSGFFTSVR